MGEGRENNCIWQKNLPNGQQRALGSQSLAMDSVPAVGNVEEAESFSLQSQFGSVQVEKGIPAPRWRWQGYRTDTGSNSCVLRQLLASSTSNFSKQSLKACGL